MSFNLVRIHVCTRRKTRNVDLSLDMNHKDIKKLIFPMIGGFPKQFFGIKSDASSSSLMQTVTCIICHVQANYHIMK